MHHLVGDVIYALRVLRRRPAYTCVSLVTMVASVAGVSALFTILNGVVLKPLPYGDEHAVAMIEATNTARPDDRGHLAVADVLDFAQRTRAFEAIAYYRYWGLTLTGHGDPEELVTALVSPNLFTVLRVQPILGRAMLPAEGVPGQDGVVMLSHATWQQRFGGRHDILGRPLTLDGDTRTVIGVLPPEFGFPDDRVELWAPQPVTPQSVQRRRRAVSAVARLARGVTIEQARADVARVAGQLAAEYPATHAGWSATATPIREHVLRNTQRPLLVLFGVTVLVLLIGVVNVANLQLAEAGSRRTELAVRRALGAGRWRLVRLFIVEALLLSIVAGSIAVVLASWLVPALLALAPVQLPRAQHIRIEPVVFAFLMAISVGAALAVGLVPGLRAARQDVQTGLKEGEARTGPGPRQARLRQALVVAEIAAALVVVVAAALLVRSLQRVQSVDPGFRTDRAVALQLFLPPNTYRQEPEIVGFYDRLRDRLRALPGVVSVGAVSALPLSTAGAHLQMPFQIEGRPAADREQQVNVRVATPEYFQAMGIPLLRGRPFSEGDGPDGPGVVIVSDTFARRHAAGRDPIGLRVLLETGEPRAAQPHDVIGVVGDIHEEGLDDPPQPTVYLPFRRNPMRTLAIAVRTAIDPHQLGPAVRSQVTAIDPQLAVFSVRPLEEIVGEALKAPRFTAVLLGMLATVALLIAASGVYGMISLTVAERTHEVGIRLALGGGPRALVGGIVARCARLVALGLIAGGAGAFAASRLMATLLFDITASDPASFGAAALVLGGVALAASYLPARRVTRIDPALVLRGDVGASRRR
jgi:putative ABC transport system permease protein